MKPGSLTPSEYLKSYGPIDIALNQKGRLLFKAKEIRLALLK
jgi:hypothetical protein